MKRLESNSKQVDAAYMADRGLEEIRANNNEMWTWVIEKEY